jgi:LPXTG-motif cell wall-anchored protein
MKRRIGLVVVLGLALSLAFLTIASAHAKLVSSDPAAGAKLTSAPSKVTLVFSEEISAKEDESFFKVTNASGAEVGTGKLDSNDLDHKTLSGTLQAGLADGVYTVAWEAVTPDDNGHTQGSFSFGINVEPGAQPTAVPHDEEEQPTAAPGQPTAAPAEHDHDAAEGTPTAEHDHDTAGGTPGNLPRTGESGPNLTPYLLIGVVVLLVGGLVLRRGRHDMRQ